MYRNVVAVGPDRKYSSAAAESTKVVSAVPSYLFDVVFANASGADAYVQIFDAAAVPSAAAVPLATQYVPNSTTAGLSFNRLPMGTGITVVISSTLATYTAVGAGAGIITVGYTVK